ncbi:MAG: 4Fe-4S dicluster domain-containing protein [Thermodesulfobacteriota bacterium]
MGITRKIIQIDEDLCNGCGECIITCAEGALEIIDGKAKLVADRYCDGLGACLGECPTGALKIIERDADDFDEAAVEHRLDELKNAKAVEPTLPCGCPSTRLQTFAAPYREQGPHTPGVSALTHWPVQIKLVPPNAPFLLNADLLVAADCTAYAHPDFHREFLAGKVLMIGCPKFDDVELYIQKFVQIFRQTPIKSVTTLVMEVPCCSGLPMIVRRAMELAGKSIPTEEIVISVRGGGILSRHKAVA